MSETKYSGVPSVEKNGDQQLIEKEAGVEEKLVAKFEPESKTEKEEKPWRKYFMAVWAVLECMLFGGLVYGWGSLVFILKQEGIYAELCHQSTNYSSNMSISADNTTSGDKDTVRCAEQDEKLQLAFTVGTTLMTFSSPVLGHIQYTFGTRIARVVLICCFLCGSLVIAFLSTSSPWLIYLGLSCVAIGGLPILVTNIQVANLFVMGGSTVVGLLSGSFDASAAVQLVVKIAYENGISRQHSYLFISALFIMVILSTFLWLPKTFIPKTESDKPDKEGDVDTADEAIKVNGGNGRMASDSDELPLRDVKPRLLDCALSRIFLSHVGWLSILQLRFYYFIGTLNPWLNYITNHDDSQVSHFTNASLFIQLAGVFTSLLGGFIFDLERRRHSSKLSITERRLQPSIVPLTLTSFLALLLSCLVLVPSSQVLYVDFVILTFFRSFMYGTGAAYLQLVFPADYFGFLYGVMIVISGVVGCLHFPADYFGFLYGVMIVISGVVGCLQYPLFIWLESPPKGPGKVNIFLLILMLSSLAHPVHIWLTCRAAGKKQAASKEQTAESEYVFISKTDKCL